jgi:hypothetical protein
MLTSVGVDNWAQLVVLICKSKTGLTHQWLLMRRLIVCSCVVGPFEPRYVSLLISPFTRFRSEAV